MNISEISTVQIVNFFIIIALIIAFLELIFKNISKIKEIVMFMIEDAAIFIKIFVIISAICLCLIKMISDANIDSFLIGVITSMIGLIVTIGIIQCILDKRDEINSKKNEDRRILRFHSLMELHIKNYKSAFYQLFTEDIFNNRFKGDFPSNIEFSKLHQCDQISVLANSMPDSSRIENFYNMEQKLLAYIVKMIENIDFKYNTSLKRTLLDLVNMLSYNSITSAIIAYTKYKKINDKTLHDFFRDEIKNDKGEILEKLHKGELEGNIFFHYAFFYEALQVEKELIILYEELIENIKKSISDSSQ